MRIISGKFKSRKINSPSAGKNDKENIIRPTSDRARESLFDILSNYVDFSQMNCLDLYAGTGGFGFECMSRGAERVTFVDKSFLSIKLIKKTYEDLAIVPFVSVYKLDSLRFLNEFPVIYDLIFADPPYGYDKNEELIKLVLEKEPVCFVLETGYDFNFKYDLEVYELIKRSSGLAHFYIFLKKD